MDLNTDADNNNAVAQVPAVPAAVPMDPPAAVNLPDDVVDAPDAVAAPPPAIHAVAPDIPAQITELGARVDQMQGSLTTILTQLAVLADPSRFRTAGSPSPVAPPAPPTATVSHATTSTAAPATISATATTSRIPERAPSYSPIPRAPEVTVLRDFTLDGPSLLDNREKKGVTNPPKFNGENTSPGDATLWTRNVRSYFRNCNMTDEGRRISSATLFLEGEAVHWANLVQSKCYTYDDFEKRFLTQWEHLELELKIYDQLLELTYESCGCVEKLFSRFNILVSLTEEMSRYPRWVHHSFLDKLPAELRDYARTDLKHLTYEEMMPHLRQRESSNAKQKLYLQSNAALPTSVTSLRNKNTSSKSSTSSGTTTTSSSTSTSKSRPVPPNVFKERVARGECGLCAAKTHTTKDCPSKASNKRATAGSSTSAKPSN